ncbi:MAG: enoyl-CoA hydratase/isomerase family protein [Desulfomonile tiedjei]|nr:enoyl-CoA hydratase/isomerase family protein [Desulfomonile tiedjei]
MAFVSVSVESNTATVVLSRGKVNALIEEVVDELQGSFRELASNPSAKTVILTGAGKFFSFGFDIPHFMDHSRDQFTAYLTKFTEFYTDLFMFPKPVVAALNGHTMAGGCIIATACDYRIMVTGKAKISLNEITFGSSIFAGSVEMLKACVGQSKAESILLSGSMYSAEEALGLGVIHQIASEQNLLEDAKRVAEDFAGRGGRAFQSLKHLLRRPITETMKKNERASILEFVDIWYSRETREQIETIKIRG